MPEALSHLWRLPVGPTDEAWGLYLTALGSGEDLAGTPPSGWTLLFVVRGAGSLALPGRRRLRVEAGEVALLASPGARLQADPQRGCRVHHLHFGGELAARWMAPGLLGPLPRVLRAGFDETQLGLVARLVELARAQAPEMGRLMAGVLAHLLARLEHAARLGAGTGSQRRLAGAARRLLADSANDGLALEALAAELGVSYPWFRRCFRAQAGLPPQRYRAQLRLDRACQLLADTDLPVGEIAGRLGFSSQAYFARCFRRETGLSPTVWRASQPRR